MIHLFFSVVNDNNVSTEKISNDLNRISEWVYQWKLIFNPDLTKRAQENIFFLGKQ